MVVLNKIYTKTGDDGTTALGNGERRAKHDLRVECYGTVDEANACIGMARLATGQSGSALDEALSVIQNDLFDLCADLATPLADNEKAGEKLRVTDSQVKAIEEAIDRFNADLNPLRSFILPGGSNASAYLHLARTVARRAERLITALGERETLNPACVHYMNRVSDFLFVAARIANDGGKDDVLWIPGKNR